MTALPFFKKKQIPNKFLTAEVNADSIKAVVFYHEEGRLRIIGAAKEKLEKDVIRAGNIIDRDIVAETLKIAIMKATNDLEEDIDKIILGIEGDLCLGLTTTIRAKRNRNEIIKQKEIDNLYDKLVSAAYIQAQNEYVQVTGNSACDLEVVLSSNVYTTLDGNKTNNLLDEKGGVIESAVFNAFSPSYHIKNLNDIARKSGVEILNFAPTLYAITQSIRESSLETIDFILVNIGLDITNVAVIFGGGIVSSKTLNIGYTHFIDGISAKMGLTNKEADRVLNTYCRGQLTESESEVVRKCIEDILDIWIDGMEILFGDFVEVKTFAHKIYLTGKGSTIPDVLYFLKEKPWAKSIPFKALPEIQKIEMVDLTKVSDATGKVTSTSWVPVVSLANIYLEMFDSL